MRRSVAAMMVAVTATFLPTASHAQDGDVPRVEVSILPAGATIFTEDDAGGPSFVGYTLAGAVAVNANHFIGFEVEVAGNIGIEQDLDFKTQTVSAQPPHLLQYTGSVLVYPGGRDNRVVPYVSGGLGGLTLFERAEVAVPENTTFFAGTLGGGLKVDATDRLGVRVDYRFVPIASKDDAPQFFGREARYGHRIVGGITVSLGR